MRQLSERQARRCEEAEHDRCRCRCGGQFHGSARGGTGADRDFYETLEADDPHRISSAGEKKSRRKMQSFINRMKKRKDQGRPYQEWFPFFQEKIT